MGIARTRTVLVRSTGPQTHQAVLQALASSGIDILDQANPIRAKSPRALLKNRWAAELTIEITEDSMTWTVDALGDKHDQLMEELLDKLPQGMVDDQGVADALSRIAKSSRFFGKAEASRLASILTPREHVVAIAVGTYEKVLGALILTTDRLVFFDRSLASQTIEEFYLEAIQSLGTNQRMTGETISISTSGRKAEITGVHHGEGEALASAFRELRHDRSSAAASTAQARPVENDVMDQIRKLGELHDSGVLTADEFTAKKAELLDRM